jgi:hypothetical protein
MPMNREDVACEPITITNTPNNFNIAMDSVNFIYSPLSSAMTFTARILVNYLNPLTPNTLFLANDIVLMYDTSGPTLVMANTQSQTFVREGNSNYWILTKILSPISAGSYGSLPITANYTLTLGDSINLQTLTGQIGWTG